MSVDSLVTNKVCADCEHGEVCRHREGYLAFVDAISEFSERCNGDKICDGVVAVNISCNYYTEMLLLEDSIDKEDCTTCIGFRDKEYEQLFCHDCLKGIQNHYKAESEGNG